THPSYSTSCHAEFAIRRQPHTRIAFRENWKCRTLTHTGDHDTSSLEVSSSRSHLKGERVLTAVAERGCRAMAHLVANRCDIRDGSRSPSRNPTKLLGSRTNRVAVSPTLGFS